jgi:cytoskeletal protein RodZ
MSPVRRHRLRAGVTLDAICHRTKISRYFLEAIEERNYHRLPGGIFDVCYLRQYAEQIGYDAAVLLADYRHAVERRHEPVAALAEASRSRPWRRLAFWG